MASSDQGPISPLRQLQDLSLGSFEPRSNKLSNELFIGKEAALGSPVPDRVRQSHRFQKLVKLVNAHLPSQYTHYTTKLPKSHMDVGATPPDTRDQVASIIWPMSQPISFPLQFSRYTPSGHPRSSFEPIGILLLSKTNGVSTNGPRFAKLRLKPRRTPHTASKYLRPPRQYASSPPQRPVMWLCTHDETLSLCRSLHIKSPKLGDLAHNSTPPSARESPCSSSTPNLPHQQQALMASRSSSGLKRTPLANKPLNTSSTPPSDDHIPASFTSRKKRSSSADKTYSGQAPMDTAEETSHCPAVTAPTENNDPEALSGTAESLGSPQRPAQRQGLFSSHSNKSSSHSHGPNNNQENEEASSHSSLHPKSCLTNLPTPFVNRILANEKSLGFNIDELTVADISASLPATDLHSLGPTKRILLIPFDLGRKAADICQLIADIITLYSQSTEEADVPKFSSRAIENISTTHLEPSFISGVKYAKVLYVWPTVHDASLFESLSPFSVNMNDGNHLFYVYHDPSPAFSGARAEGAILASIKFVPTGVSIDDIRNILVSKMKLITDLQHAHYTFSHASHSYTPIISAVVIPNDDDPEAKLLPHKVFLNGVPTPIKLCLSNRICTICGSNHLTEHHGDFPMERKADHRYRPNLNTTIQQAFIINLKRLGRSTPFIEGLCSDIGVVLTSRTSEIEWWTCLLPDCNFARGKSFLGAWQHMRHHAAAMDAHIAKRLPIPKETWAHKPLREIPSPREEAPQDGQPPSLQYLMANCGFNSAAATRPPRRHNRREYPPHGPQYNQRSRIYSGDKHSFSKITRMGRSAEEGMHITDAHTFPCFAPQALTFSHTLPVRTSINSQPTFLKYSPFPAPCTPPFSYTRSLIHAPYSQVNRRQTLKMLLPLRGASRTLSFSWTGSLRPSIRVDQPLWTYPNSTYICLIILPFYSLAPSITLLTLTLPPRKGHINNPFI